MQPMGRLDVKEDGVIVREEKAPKQKRQKFGGDFGLELTAGYPCNGRGELSHTPARSRKGQPNSGCKSRSAAKYLNFCGQEQCADSVRGGELRPVIYGKLERREQQRVEMFVGRWGESGAGRIEARVWCGRVDKITKTKAKEVLKCCEVAIVEPSVKHLECFNCPLQELGRDGPLLSSPGRAGNGEE